MQWRSLDAIACGQRAIQRIAGRGPPYAEADVGSFDMTTPGHTIHC